jgi:hypothetical protein
MRFSPPIRALTRSGLLLLTASTLIAAPATSQPPRLKRAESFLGIHFDFHARPNNPEIGAKTTRSMIENIIDRVKPDFIQIDCKGHPGYSSYPTKVGQPAPAIAGDPLRVWRDVTAARGVALFVHYSGVFDSHAATNPGWGVINADGKTNPDATSFWGPYAKERLIPQLCELAEYGVDGAWVDGECWASVVDYSPAALTEFRKATGFDTIPRAPGEPYWFEFVQFHREAFRRYLRHYVMEVNKVHPAFQICSNWAFTDHMPDPVTAPVAFLSGDYSPSNSVNSARLSARYISQQGKPWDLMAWSFALKPNPPGQNATEQKSVVQLKREAAVVLAQGGGFQAYFQQKPDGSIYDEQMTVMAEVAAFCRARQAFVHRSKTVPQIAVLLSTADQHRRNHRLFPRSLSRVEGTLQALLEGQQAVDVVGEHRLTGRMADYPLIVIPECDYLDPKFRDELTTYVHRGGNLLLVGPASAKLFARELGATFTGEPAVTGRIRLTYGGMDAPIDAGWQAVTLSGNARRLGELRSLQLPDAPALVAGSFATHGRGRLAAVYFTAGLSYVKNGPAPVRDFLAAIVRELFPAPMVEVKGTHDVDVTVARNHGKLLVHLINTSGPHATQAIQETVPPLGALEVAIRLPKPPAEVTLEPGTRALAFTYRDGRVHFTVPSIALYDIIVVQE